MWLKRYQIDPLTMRILTNYHSKVKLGKSLILHIETNFSSTIFKVLPNASPTPNGNQNLSLTNLCSHPSYIIYLKFLFCLSVTSSSPNSSVGGPYSLSLLLFSLARYHRESNNSKNRKIRHTMQEMKPPEYLGPGVVEKRMGAMILPVEYPMKVARKVHWVSWKNNTELQMGI